MFSKQCTRGDHFINWRLVESKGDAAVEEMKMGSTQVKSESEMTLIVVGTGPQ